MEFVVNWVVGLWVVVECIEWRGEEVGGCVFMVIFGLLINVLLMIELCCLFIRKDIMICV